MLSIIAFHENVWYHRKVISTVLRETHSHYHKKAIQTYQPNRSIAKPKPKTQCKNMPMRKSNQSNILPKRYMGICTLWNTEQRYGFFRELLNGWECFGHDRDIRREPDSATCPKCGDTVEFSIDTVCWRTVREIRTLRNGRICPAPGMRRLNIRHITLPGGLLFGED